MNNKLYTIIVPTRDRVTTLNATIQSCLAQDFDNLQIIVSDNCSVDETEDLVRSFSDSRLKYIKTPKRLSMADSFEYALKHSRPSIALTIGDDDGLSYGCIKRVDEIIRETGTKILTTEKAQYDWPGMSKNRSNQIQFSLNKGYERRKVDEYYLEVLNGWRSYYEIPLIYHCFFDTEYLNLFRKKNGRVFNSQQIDIFSAMQFAAFEIDYVHSFEPLIINGASPKSNGAQHFGHVVDQSEVKKWESENNIPLLKPFKFCKSIRYLILESYLQALEQTPCLSRFKPNIKQILKNSLVELWLSNSYKQSDAITEVAEYYLGTFNYSKLGIIKDAMMLKAKRSLKRLLKLRSAVVIDCRVEGVFDIYGAMDLMHRHLNGKAKNKTTLLSQLKYAIKR